VQTANPLQIATDHEGERFSEEIAAAFDRAAGSTARRMRLLVGDVGVEFRFADPRLGLLVERAMGHLESDGVRPGLRIDFFSGGTLPPAPWPIDEPRAKGEIGPDAPTARFRACMQQDLPALHLFDRATRRGWVWYRDPERLPSWEHPHLPLRVLHFAFADRDWFAVHGAVVEKDGLGVLIPGRSGSGKTTTAIAALAGGFRFLGDDHVVVRTSPEPEAASLFATTRLTDHSRDLLASIGLEAPVAAAPTPPSDKALFYLSDFAGTRVGRRARLGLIALPRRTASPAEPTRCTSAEALRDLAPSTVLFLPHAGAIGTFGRLARLVRSLPSFHLPLGGDLSRIGGLLDGLLQRATADTPG
jgi:hypothetical protein